MLPELSRISCIPGPIWKYLGWFLFFPPDDRTVPSYFIIILRAEVNYSYIQPISGPKNQARRATDINLVLVVLLPGVNDMIEY